MFTVDFESAHRNIKKPPACCRGFGLKQLLGQGDLDAVARLVEHI